MELKKRKVNTGRKNQQQPVFFFCTFLTLEVPLMDNDNRFGRNKGDTIMWWSPAATPEASDQTSLSHSSKSAPGENSLQTVSRLLWEPFPV